MPQARLVGLGLIVAACGLGALLTASLLAPSAEGIFAIAAWATAAALLLLSVGLHAGSNAARIAAIVFFGLFALSDIPVLVLALMQWPNTTKALAPSPGFVAAFAGKAWAVWYLTRPAVRDAFASPRASVARTALP